MPVDGRWSNPTPTRRSLADAGARHDLVAHRIALHNQLLAVLQHNFPGAIGFVQPARHPHQPGLPASLPDRSQSRLVDRRRGRTTDGALVRGQPLLQPSHPRRLVDNLTQAAQGPSTGVAAEAAEVIVTALVDLLTTIRAQQDRLETRIREALLAHPDSPIFQSLPPAGTMRAATLLAGVGDCQPGS